MELDRAATAFGPTQGLRKTLGQGQKLARQRSSGASMEHGHVIERGGTFRKRRD